MAEFGKRKPQTAHNTVAYRPPVAAQGDLPAAVAVVQTGKLPYWAKTSPGRIVFILLAAAGGFWWLILPYAGDVLRDHRLAGTWQPAYDMHATEGKCTRYNFVVTICTAKIRSYPEPNKIPVEIQYMMAVSSGGGEALVPIRSTVDPSAITIAYAAETKLMNRTLTFIGMAGGFAAMFLFSLTSLMRGRYVGGAAHRALVAGLQEMKARLDKAQADPRPTV